MVDCTYLSSDLAMTVVNQYSPPTSPPPVSLPNLAKLSLQNSDQKLYLVIRFTVPEIVRIRLGLYGSECGFKVHTAHYGVSVRTQAPVRKCSEEVLRNSRWNAPSPVC